MVAESHQDNSQGTVRHRWSPGHEKEFRSYETMEANQGRSPIPLSRDQRGASAYGQNLVTETGCEMYSVSNRGNSRVPYSCKETAHALLVEVEKARPFMGK